MITFEELDELFRKHRDGRVTDFISQLVEAIEDAGYKIPDFHIDLGCDPGDIAIVGMSLRFGQGWSWDNTVSVETNFTDTPWTTTFRDNRGVDHPLRESTFRCSQASAVSEAILNFHKYWFIDVPRRRAEDAKKAEP